MYTNVKCLCCREVEAVEYFKLLGVRHGNKIAITQRVKFYLGNSLFLVKLQSAILQLYLISAPAQISEDVIVIQRGI